MARKDSEHQKKSMSKLFRGKAISILSSFQQNPHFEMLPSLLQRERIDADPFMQSAADTII